MVKYLVIHNKHEGCYDFHYYEDEEAKIRLTSITINPPKIFMFNNKEQAQDFFEEYINDVDVLDARCKKDDDVVHIDYCTCGIIELDDEENPILFYNKKNQIFLLEHGPETFFPPHELKEDIKNLNLTNRLIRKAKTLSREQRKRYIELGKYCEECTAKKEADKTEIYSDGETEKQTEKPTEKPIEKPIETQPEKPIETQPEKQKEKKTEKKEKKTEKKNKQT
jgi:hypothetical protein